MVKRENLTLANTKYVVPNSITALSLVLGLISMFYATNGNYVTAGWVILYCAILDKLDGSTARVLNASTPFGGQMDSFSDFVAFGIAPAYLVFSVCTKDPIVSKIFLESSEPPFFLYFSLVFLVLASALRLARFNVTALEDSKHMFGLATTAAGGFIATYVLSCYNNYTYDFAIKLLQYLPYYIFILAALEISSFPIIKIGYKETKFARIGEIVYTITALLCVFTRSFPEFLFLSSSTYAIAGFVHAFKDREIIMAQAQNGISDEDGKAEEASESTDKENP